MMCVNTPHGSTTNRTGSHFGPVASAAFGGGLSAECSVEQIFPPLVIGAPHQTHDVAASTQDVKIREIVKYTNYKRFGSNVKITYQGKEIPKAGDATQKPQSPQ
jgi:hypothetical protein